MKLTLALSLLLPAVVAHAADKPASGPRASFSGHGENVRHFIQAHDLDGDGAIDRAEFERFRRQRFEATDLDRDGAISLPEYVTEFDARLDEMLKPELAAIDGMTRTRFSALAGGGSHVTRERYDASGARIYAAYAADKLPTALPAADGRRRLLDLPTTHSRNGLMALYDRNSDSHLAREEFDTARAEQFERTDVNRDGRIGFDEYATEYGERIERARHDLNVRAIRQTRVRFGVLDKNRDDRVDWGEYMASGQRLFDGNDRNGDGRVDATDATHPPKPRTGAN
ncbi:EF-hand domain-containing protein [Lysobacter pythonis]|uniref:EF-hand domain-containing protein n=1 Tax=Solilutibacter pythonis TaxID=2483112 RepID=A0A3M2HTE1_9GAMM|nr:EF-hand domain-containing protein [Lysobacter pythonis]RMH93016.1 EF-hand domain-containing protein [Lysobacter pythonis]